MEQASLSELERLGRQAAEQIAGSDAIGGVEVNTGIDSLDRPAYYFHFLVNQAQSRERIGLVRIRVGQQLADYLAMHGDEHRSYIHTYDQEDWPKRSGAGAG